MKRVYFVRHGESEGNAGPVRLGANGSLTELGKRQARALAARAAKLPLEAVIASSLPRARETAEIIGRKIKRPPETSDLFVERRRPSEQAGHLKGSPRDLAIDRALAEGFAQPGFRFSDEENFEDLALRSDRALAFLAERREADLLVVTHGFFLRVMLARAVFGDELTASVCDRFICAFETEKTGLTVFRYEPENARSPWKTIIWNDHAHLG